MSEAPITVSTRTGRELHAGYPGSSVTHCGRWLKVNCVAYKVADGTDAVTCDKCRQQLERREA